MSPVQADDVRSNPSKSPVKRSISLLKRQGSTLSSDVDLGFGGTKDAIDEAMKSIQLNAKRALEKIKKDEPGYHLSPNATSKQITIQVHNIEKDRKD